MAMITFLTNVKTVLSPIGGYIQRMCLPIAILLPVLLFAGSGCVTLPTEVSRNHRETKSYDDVYPRSSPDAGILITLQSNQEKTDFYVDEKWVVKGKRAKIYVNDTPHTIRAKPEGYRAKEDFVQPPYYENATIGFYFLIEDKEGSNAIISGTTPAIEKGPIAYVSDPSGIPQNDSSGKLREHVLKIAVVEFDKRGQSEMHDAGKTVADWITTSLNKTKVFEVYDRLSLDKLLSEYELGHSGLLDEKTLAQIGKIHGVQAVVTGSIIELNNAVSVTTKLIDTETAKIIDSANIKVNSFDNVAFVTDWLANELARE